MGTYILRRLLLLFPVLLGVSFVTFAIAYVTPGDPVHMMLGPSGTKESVERLRHELGLDDPFPVQYARYVWNALHGDLGRSYRNQTSVMSEIAARFPSTLQLTVVALIFATLTGVSVGIIAGRHPGGILDGVVMLGSLTGLSIPGYYIAILCVLLFGVKLRWVSVVGRGELKDLILPALCLALPTCSILARMTRSCLLEVLHEDYVRTARAKGLRERTIMFRHVLRNAAIPILTVLGMQFADLLGGAVFIESVFARTGLGTFAINAITSRDLPQVEGTVLFGAAAFVIVNLLVDLVYGLVDPRIRLSTR